MHDPRRLTACAVGVLAGALAIASCTAPGADSPADPDTGGDTPHLLVWVDETRTPAVQQYAGEHPEVQIELNTIPSDAGYVNSQVALANNAGSGWPDVVFLNTQEDVAVLASESMDAFPLQLDDLVGQEVIDGFSEGALDVCTFDGGVYCMRNDIGQTVLWVNQTLMDEFGYEVPTTWEDYEALANQVAADHPGYVVGGLLGKWGAGTYFAASGCPTRDAVSLTEVVINTSVPECTKMARMLGNLLSNGTVLPLAHNDPAMRQIGVDGQVLMYPGPSWYGDFTFTENGFDFADGDLAAAPMPAWEGEVPESGSVGGGAFVVSRHTEFPEEAAALAEWLATDIDLQAGNPTYPAFVAAAEKWCEAKSTSAFYATDPCPVLRTEADRISPTFGSVRYANEWAESFNELFVNPVADGADPLDALTSWGEQLVLAAEDNGYEVSASR